LIRREDEALLHHIRGLDSLVSHKPRELHCALVVLLSTCVARGPTYRTSSDDPSLPESPFRNDPWWLLLPPQSATS